MHLFVKKFIGLNFILLISKRLKNVTMLVSLIGKSFASRSNGTLPVHWLVVRYGDQQSVSQAGSWPLAGDPTHSPVPLPPPAQEKMSEAKILILFSYSSRRMAIFVHEVSVTHQYRSEGVGEGAVPRPFLGEGKTHSWSLHLLQSAIPCSQVLHGGLQHLWVWL